MTGPDDDASADWGMAPTGQGEARSGAGWTSEARPAPPPGADPAPGVQAGPFAVAEPERYEDGGMLGRGGMGVVHAALDRRLGRVVARKRVAAGPHGPAARARLAREAAITARLDHPGIVQVYDAGVDPAGEPFYTMRLVAGRTLADAIAAQPGLDQRLRLLRRLHAAIEAVAYAHGRGVVHRDLKPANILIGGFGETQVVDWGLAVEIEPGQAAEDGGAGTGQARHAPAIARVGTVVGTPGYLSPEAAAGTGPVTPRADVYSLGVALAELVVGRPPFAGPGRGDAVTAAAAGALPGLAALEPRAPAELAAIVARATARDPGARYADAGALAADLEAFLDGRVVEAYRYSSWDQVRRLARAWRGPLLAGALALTVLALGLALAYRRTAAERDRAVAAEQRTQTALRRADADFGRALLGSARAAAAEGLLPEAEILAAHALRLGGDPEARGILMRCRVQTVARVGTPVPLPPGCLHRIVDAAGDVLLCLEPDAVALYDLDAAAPPRLRWRVAERAEDGAITASGVVLTRGVDDVVALDPASGAVRHRPRLVRGQGAWLRTGPPDVALRFAVDGFALVDAATGAVTSAATCGGRGTVAVARAPDVGPLPKAVAAVCDSGRVELVPALGPALAPVDTGLGIARRSASAAWWSADGERLFVGTQDGTLGAFAMPGGRRLYAVRAGVGQIRQLAGDDRRLVVAGERGGVEVWEQRTGALLARLPAVAGRRVAMRADGELRTFGAAMTRWRLPATPRALRLPGGDRAHGLASLALAPDATRVALPRADGTLLVARTADGEVVLEDHVQDAVLKFAAWSADGTRLAVVGPRPPGLVEYTATTGWPRRVVDVAGGYRRVVELRSGARVLARYGAGLQVVATAGRPQPPRYEPVAPGGAQPAFRDLATTPDLRHGVAVDAAGGVHRFADGADVRFARVGRVDGAEVADIATGGDPIAVASPGRVTVLAASGAVLRTAATGGGRVHDIAWSPDGRLLALAETSGSARILDAATLRPLALLAGHDRRVAAVSFDAAARWLATASWDGSALLWDVSTLAQPAAALQAEAEARWGIGLDAVVGPRAERDVP